MQYRNYLPRIPLWHLVLTYCKSGAEGNRMAQPNGRLQSSAADQNPMKAGHPSASIKIYRYSFCCPGCHTCAKEISIFRPDRTIQQQGRCHRRPIPFVSPGNSGFCGDFYRQQCFLANQPKKSSYGSARAGIAPSGNHGDWVIWATM